ncbi:trypsin-like serine peptidase [Pseudomonas moraviensis]|uniref:trypsin-like serine peptidase n=1 Tax=Pseudomonas moraviensis TaxID=321662 RepID=UPI001059FB04|nr:serine protease [Pseudomonas moraviensis]TDK55125.1 serine protease [Pseudomonas moraviensis]
MHCKSRIILAISLIALTTSQTSCAHGIPDAPEPVLLSNAEDTYGHWNGIGKIIQNDRPYCTAFLLDTRSTDNATVGPAYILTNAHCTSVRVGTATNIPYQGQIQFNYFHDTLENGKRYDISKINWASFASTDIAIMELDASLGTLLKDGVTPLKLASAAVDSLTQVNVVGAPVSAPGLQLSACTQEAGNQTLTKYLNVHVDYHKQNCKGIEPGSSGSPVLDASSGELLGISSGTTYGISSDDLCFWHGLCDDNKKSAIPNQASQSFPINYLADCFNNGNFDPGASNCQLSPHFNFQFGSKSRAISDISLHKRPVEHGDPTPAWDIDFSMNTRWYRFKTVRDAEACYSPNNYSPPISTINARVESEIGREAGMYYLCVTGADTAEGQPDNGFPGNPQILAARVVPPVLGQLPEPTLTAEPDGDDLFIQYRESADRNLWTQIYVGAAQETQCAEIEPKQYTKVDDGFFVPIEALPLTLCSFTMDRNLSTSNVRTDQLQHP